VAKRNPEDFQCRQALEELAALAWTKRRPAGGYGPTLAVTVLGCRRCR
jgi:hypothetical protein